MRPYLGNLCFRTPQPTQTLSLKEGGNVTDAILIHLFCCTWLWVNTCDVSRTLPYLHVTVSKCTWWLLWTFPLCFARDREYIVPYFDTITWLVMIGENMIEPCRILGYLVLHHISHLAHLSRRRISPSSALMTESLGMTSWKRHCLSQHNKSAIISTGCVSA